MLVNTPGRLKNNGLFTSRGPGTVYGVVTEKGDEYFLARCPQAYVKLIIFQGTIYVVKKKISRNKN
mgnify:CR=1 FL=1